MNPSREPPRGPHSQQRPRPAGVPDDLFRTGTLPPAGCPFAALPEKPPPGHSWPGASNRQFPSDAGRACRPAPPTSLPGQCLKRRLDLELRRKLPSFRHRKPSAAFENFRGIGTAAPWRHGGGLRRPTGTALWKPNRILERCSARMGASACRHGSVPRSLFECPIFRAHRRSTRRFPPCGCEGEAFVTFFLNSVSDIELLFSLSNMIE